MTRFFVAPEELIGDTITLTGENAQHAAVLRLKEGEEIVLCDGQGREALCAVVRCANKFTDVEVKQRRESLSEAAVREDYLDTARMLRRELWEKRKTICSSAEISCRKKIEIGMMLSRLYRPLRQVYHKLVRRA